MPPVHLSRQLSLYNQFSTNALQSQRGKQAQLQEQMATGKRVNRASDDPNSFNKARQLEVLTKRYDQFDRSITNSRGFATQSQDQLQQLTERMVEARDLGIRARNDSFSEQERQLMANEVRGIRDAVIGHLNSKHGNEYIFAGTNTTEQPFDAEGEPTADLSGERRRQIGPSLNDDPALDSNRMKINITGDEVLNVAGGGTIIEALDDLIDVMEGTAPMEDFDDILGAVDNARDHLVDRAAQAGSIVERLSLAEDQLRESTFTAEQQRSELEDVDFYELATDFQRTQASLQATLQMTSSTLQTTLLDFLR